MSYEFIGFSASVHFKHHNVFCIAALSGAALNESSNMQSNVSGAIDRRPSARAPDTPSSTR